MSKHALCPGDRTFAAAPARNPLLCAASLLLVVPAVLVAACTEIEEPAETVWVALHAYSTRGLPENSLLPMGRLRPDGTWDLPWPKSFGVSLGAAEQPSLIRVDHEGMLLPPESPSESAARPGIHWLLPYELAASGRPRSVAPVQWHRYAVGEGVQGRPVQATALLHTDNSRCGFWVMRGRGEIEGAVPAGLALSRPALGDLAEDDVPGLDEMLTAAGFQNEPSDSDGGYDSPGDLRNPAGRYPRRTIAGLARVGEDRDVAMVRYEEAGPRFGGHVVTWALVELRDGRAKIISTFSGNASLCARQPAENRTEALWVALVSRDGSRLDPIGRRHHDGNWDLPWPDLVEAAGVDSSGYLHPLRSPPDEPRISDEDWLLPFRVAGEDRLRIDAPLQWYRYVRRNVVPGTVTHVMLASRHCLAGWSLRMDPYWNMSGPEGRGGDVAFNLPSAVRLTTEDLPGLDSIQAGLGLRDRPPPNQGGYQKGDDWYPKREILGLFQVYDIIIGVVGEYHYEGGTTIVFEVSSNSARIVSEADGGGC